MNDTLFAELSLSDNITRAIDEQGFLTATEIQAQAIPLIKAGYDVIGRSQTGTGKTIAFGIPALELIETCEDKNTVQVLILCPTRELAQQGCEEIKKLAMFMNGIKIADVYGGAAMDRQIVKLKKANIVIGTPGRIMDHLRRKTLKLNNLKMIILDEADEMLNMGFREDIETILIDVPTDRQTILFSATMPPAIMALTKTYQKDPKLVSINSKQVTIDNIEQFYLNAPMGKKQEVLNLLLKYHRPHLAMIFCNTKRMVDEVTDFLNARGFKAQGLHGDMKQAQRTKVMDDFKMGKTAILVATDVAARGIDVNDIDYVINYDIPQNNEYYVHRIGRTGRAGKSGCSITICSGRRQTGDINAIARMTRSTIKLLNIPSVNDITTKEMEANTDKIEKLIKGEISNLFVGMVGELSKKGFPPELIAAAALQLHFGLPEKEVVEVKQLSRSDIQSFKKIVLSIGRDTRVAPNHIVAAITERSSMSGSDIGKIEIFDNRTIVSIPAEFIDGVIADMAGCKICGKPVVTSLFQQSNHRKSMANGARPPFKKKPNYR